MAIGNVIENIILVIHLGAINCIPEYHLFGCVSKGLELDVADLVVSRVGLEVHVAGHVEVHPGRVTEHTVPEIKKTQKYSKVSEKAGKKSEYSEVGKGIVF